MPANRVVETVHIGPFSTIESFNLATLPRPGELGVRTISTAGKEYQLVQLDSGATAANAVGVVAAGQVAYWKSKTNYLVTNDFKQCFTEVSGATTNKGFRNAIAGVFTVAATAGYYTYVQTKGNKTGVAIASGSPVMGDSIVGDTTASTAQGIIVTAGTAPTCNLIGHASASGTTVTSIAVDLDIPDIP